MSSSAHSSAGVYVKELDLSQRIAAASTSIGAIVGASRKGPIMERTLITSAKNFIEVFGTPDPKTSYLHYCALQFLGESSRLYVTRVASDDTLTAGAYWTVDDISATTPVIHLTNFDDGTNNPLGKADPFNTLGFDPQTPGIENIVGFFCAANPGDWNDRLMIRIKPSTKRATSAPDDPLVFLVEIFLDYQSPRQLPNESFLVSRDYRLDGFGAQMNIEEIINNRSSLVRYRANPYALPELKVLMEGAEFLTGGTNGSRVTDGLVNLGWELYRDPEQLDVNIFINGGYSTPAVQMKMDDICQSRMDCIAVLDVPSAEQEVARAIAYKRNMLNLDSSRSAIYSPDLKIYDQYNDFQVFVPPSGFVAAAYAKTDYVAETWFAPAGMSRGDMKILGVRRTYNQGDRDALQPVQINPMRVFPGKGYKIWGADTCQSMASALSNVNVRRLLNFVEKSISVAALYSVFDPNDSILRAFLREMCERFLQPIQNGRGLYSFQVVCDESNNTPATIAAGELILDVYLDPVIPAKRIHLNAVVMKTGTNYKELALARSGQ